MPMFRVEVVLPSVGQPTLPLQARSLCAISMDHFVVQRSELPS